MRIFISVRNQFIGFHRYKNAPKEVAFLRDYHRHLFKVTTRFEVGDSNREREFFIEQKKIQKYLDKNYAGKKFEESCEMIASKILKKFYASQVIVSEDGENEGMVINYE